MDSHDRRSSGGYRGGHNRKRRYRDDDENDRRPQRRKYEEPNHVKLRKRLLSIAELRPEEMVDEISKVVVEGFEDTEIHDTFLNIILELSLEQPFKIPFLAAIVLSANTQKPAIAREVIEAASTALEQHVGNGSWREVKLVLRFLACLQGLFEGDGVFTILDELFSRVVDLQTASSEDGLGLELVKIILLTIAYTMASSASGLRDRAFALLEKTDIVASTPHALESLVDPYPGNMEDVSHEPRSLIGLLQSQLQAEEIQGWPLTCLPRPWRGSEAFESLASASKHTLPEISIPSPVTAGQRPRLPEIYISVYSDQEVQTVPSEDSVASSILRDSVVDTINILDFNRNIAAKSLIDLDCYFTPGTFVKRATPYDKLREMDEEESKWKPEDVAVDAVFSQLFQLPSPEHKLVYYHSVLTEACKIAPAAIAPSLGRAIRFLYKNVDMMDLELMHRFMDWFSHHLSNFGFTWKWTEWVSDVELSFANPKKSFIIGALEKEIRLSFAQRIKGTLPEPYQPLLSDAKEQDVPDFKYTDDREPYAPQAREILRLLRSKAPDTEIQGQIVAIQDAAVTRGVVDPLIASTDVFVTSLCVLGAKSMSHVLSCIERCRERLLAIGTSSNAARRQIVGSVLAYWAEKPGVGINIVDKLLNYTILTPMAVVEWVFLDELKRGKILTRSHIYEMISNTIFKVTNRVRQIVSARKQEGLAAEQVAMLDGTLQKELKQMKDLFIVLEDALKGIADGSADAMAESQNQDTEGEGWLRAWGRAWLRVFRRKLAVEEAWVQETLAAKPEVDLTSNGQIGGDEMQG